MSFPNFVALIPAAGAGTRMGEATPKQYLPIAGKPMLQHVIDTFCVAPLIDRVVVVVSAEDGYIEQLTLPPRCQVLRCGGDHAHVQVDRCRAAQSGDLPFLQHTQQARLQVQRHVPDLVEEKGAALGLLEQAAVVAMGSGEGPFLMPEQQALDEVFGQGRAIEGDERRMGAG
jgi:hypothetical protein